MILRLTDIVKKFSNVAVPILDQVTLEVNKGEFCVMVGSNGSGKSTLFKVIAGEYQASSGSIKFEDREITREAPHHRASYMSYLTQNIDDSTVGELTVLENTILAMTRGDKVRWRRYSDMKDAAVAAVTQIGLQSSLDKPIAFLSGGERQMIATMMAFISSPMLTLLDEHTSALDYKNQAVIMEYTARKIEEHKATVLMITHNLLDAARYGSRLLMLHKGKIVVDVSGKEKKSLSSRDIVDIFHQYEDQVLLQSEAGGIV